jgi:hypothetical protein
MELKYKATMSFEGHALRVELTNEERQLCTARRMLKRTVRSTRVGEIDFEYECGKTTDGDRVVPAEVSSLVPAGKSFGYDTIWDVTKMRFTKSMQREEIQTRLPFHISTGSVSNLSREGLAYFSCCQKSSAAKLGKHFRKEAFILNIDGTNEGGKYNHYRCIDNITGIVVFAKKIKTENAHDIASILREIKSLYGMPHAVVSDMSGPTRRAIIDVFGEDFPHIICQFHFLRDVGKDLLAAKHEKLRSYISKSKLTEKLNKYHSAVSKLIEDSSNEDKEDYIKILQLLTWIRDYKNDLSGKGIPFDLSWLRLYERASEALNVIDDILGKPKPYLKLSSSERMKVRQQKNPTSWTKLKAIRKSLADIIKDNNATKAYQTLVKENALFTELRDAFYQSEKLYCSEDTNSPLSEKNIGDENDITVGEVSNNLNDIVNRIENSPDQTTGDLVVLKHLKKYIPYLAVELIVNEKVIQLPRTNNMSELNFRETKREVRMITGQKNLSKAMDHLPAEIAYMRNFTNDKYMGIVYGEQQVFERFAQVEQQELHEVLTVMKEAMPESLVGKPIRKETFIQDFSAYFKAS